MSDYLFQYRGIDPSTWVYLSSLLLIGLFFKFGRLWSVRNLDLILLILLGPGLLMVHRGQLEQAQLGQREPTVTADVTTSVAGPETPSADASAATSARASGVGETGEGVVTEWLQLELWGFIYLLVVSCLILTRLLLDPIMVRRPLLEPNLSRGGLLFIGISLYVFLMGNLIAEPELPVADDAADYRIARVAAASQEGPGYELLSVLPTGLSKAFCIGSQLLMVAGMVLVGFWHFRNITMGIGAATLYLMMPYTSMLTGRVEHILSPAC